MALCKIPNIHSGLGNVLKDKTMDDKFIYISNNDKQKLPIHRVNQKRFNKITKNLKP